MHIKTLLKYSTFTLTVMPFSVMWINKRFHHIFLTILEDGIHEQYIMYYLYLNFFIHTFKTLFK